jgi:serine/threonine protein kinase
MSLDHFINRERIGDGGNADIFLAYDTNLNKNVVLKIVSLKSRWRVEQLIVKTLQDVDGVIRFIETVENDENVIFVMPHAPTVLDLFYFQTNYPNNILDENLAKKLFRQLVSIVVDLKDKRVFHMDIKPENILVDTVDYSITLIDFGAAVFNKKDTFKTIIGTLLFLPPEIFVENEMDCEMATVWSLGIVLYCMLSGDVPYIRVDQIISNRLPIIHTVSDEAMNVIRCCLMTNIEHRYSLNELFECEWLN